MSGGNVVAKSGNYAPSIMQVAETGEGSILFSNLRWYNAAQGEISQVVGKILKSNYFNNAGEQVVGDLELVKLTNGQIWVREVSGAGKFTLQQIDDWTALATNFGKGSNREKVMLGEFIEGSSSSYITRAKIEGYTFFDMGNKWDEAKMLVDNGVNSSWKAEMWKINKKFIDNQKASGKEFYFSQEPWSFPSKPLTFRFREAEYFIDLGAKDFQKLNENTWKVIW